MERKRKAKFIELTEKQKYCKRKFEEEEGTKIEKKVEKRKKLFCTEPKKKLHINQSNENISKINMQVNNSIHSKSTTNLLNYFSKVTSEQLEIERLKKTRVTVKAEIHNPHDFPTFDLSSTNENKKSSKPKKHLSSRKLVEEYNEICVIQSETLAFSPSGGKLEPSIQQSKPKWSLKVQLQQGSAQRPAIDEEIYTPTALSTQLKETVKNCRNIPKVLLPIKIKKIAAHKSSSLSDKNREKDSVNVKTNIKNQKDDIKENKVKQIEPMSSNLNFKIKKNYDYCTEDKIEDSSVIFYEKNISNKMSAGKLAPLFLKTIRCNQETIDTKQLFLQLENNKHSNMKEKIKFELMVQKVSPFPKISHINQITPDLDKIKTLNKLDKTYNFFEKKLFEPSLNHSTMKTFSKLKNQNLFFGEVYESVKADIDFALAELQTYYSDVQSLWKIISKLSESKNLTQILVKGKQKELSTQSNDLSHTSCLWTDKYKPSSSHEVVGNEGAVSKLKSWLENWQSLKTNEDYSSSEEFYISDSSLSSDINSNQVAVLIGPHGSGKTASVYAVAQELGYMVLEVNASSKRPGKKILKELEEATKSHRVKHFDLENSFAVSSCSVEKNDKTLKKSLIFMEDIDLIFEEDDGFVSATFQLASNTKRPIVMTMRNACLHLPKIAPQQLQINFQPVVGKKIIVILQLIALAESGYQLSQSCINALCQDGDLRKSFLQLQYLLLSGKERILHTSLATDDLSWKNMKTYIYKPAIKTDKIRKKHFQDHETIKTLVQNLDDFTLMSNLMKIDDPITSTNIKCEPSMSLIQNDLPFSSLDSISLEIGHWISNSIKNSSIQKEKTNQPFDGNESAYFLSKEQFIIHINSTLSKIALSLDCQSINLDYLPIIRNICRAEEVRNQLNSKRGNRFFHYLQNSRLLNGTMKTSKIFSAACKILQEKIIYITKL